MNMQSLKKSMRGHRCKYPFLILKKNLPCNNGNSKFIEILVPWLF